ncbi:MAG: HAD-IIB family hydrolase [Spirochaetales bacterium]|nr:HAD-IIB family hydrolase [Spirochaetales bacterium]
MYICLVNIHGLLRSENIEMGRDADTGGQTRYVLEMVKELSTHKDVTIDIMTRRIQDKRVSNDYSKKFEEISDNCRIVRLACGGKKYVRKERLWPELDEFVDNMVEFFRQQKKIPDVVHGHYADGGYAAREVARIFGIPFVFTGHSLGRNKLSYLTSAGTSEEKLKQYYHIHERIRHEEYSIRDADMVITSTEFERDELYKDYEHKKEANFCVIPPGVDLNSFFPYYHYEIQDPSITEDQKMAQYELLQKLQRFHLTPEKPVILALCRPERRKNIDLLIDVYGNSKELQAIANLAIFAGIRDDINAMEEGEKQVLTDMLLLMDRYDLYGKMAIPKHHNPFTDVPEMYRIAAMRKGVFVSAAALENFGLTFIEASATGLPFVATNKGGVKDIEKNCSSGILVDVDDPKQLEKAIRKILTDEETWTKLSEQGIQNTRNVYSWSVHTQTYLKELEKIISEYHSDAKQSKVNQKIGKRIGRIEKFLIVDIDDTLTGDSDSLNELKGILREKRNSLGFGVATGRDLESARAILDELNMPSPDVLITSVGTEIYYGPDFNQDKGWSHYIRRRWYPERVYNALDKFPELERQPENGTQREFKVSYFVKEGTYHKDLPPAMHTKLDAEKCGYNLIVSQDAYVDVIPYRSSKGNAIKYFAWKWSLDLKDVFTAGDSGNDLDMLSGAMKSIIVSNHEKKLDKLKKSRKTYFSSKAHAAGIIDGLEHYKIL